MPRESFLARGLEPFLAGLWTFFVLDSLLVAALWASGIGEGWLERWVSNADLRITLVWLLARSDILWITLSAANVYSSLTRQVGLGLARRWAALILAGVVVLAWVSVATGFPLGRIRYGTALGRPLGPVPVGLPLLWFAVIIGARDTVQWGFPRVGRALQAAAVGVIGALTDLNLESLAADGRGFWFWSGATAIEAPSFTPPVMSPVVWGVFAGAMTLALTGQRVETSGPWKPALTLGMLNGVFLVAHGARWWW